MRLKIGASEPGPIAIDVAFWSAENNVLHTVPVRIRGAAVEK